MPLHFSIPLYIGAISRGLGVLLGATAFLGSVPACTGIPPCTIPHDGMGHTIFCITKSSGLDTIGVPGHFVILILTGLTWDSLISGWSFSPATGMHFWVFSPGVHTLSLSFHGLPGVSGHLEEDFSLGGGAIFCSRFSAGMPLCTFWDSEFFTGNTAFSKLSSGFVFQVTVLGHIRHSHRSYHHSFDLLEQPGRCLCHLFSHCHLFFSAVSALTCLISAGGSFTGALPFISGRSQVSHCLEDAPLGFFPLWVTSSQMIFAWVLSGSVFCTAFWRTYLPAAPLPLFCHFLSIYLLGSQVCSSGSFWEWECISVLFGNFLGISHSASISAVSLILHLHWVLFTSVHTAYSHFLRFILGCIFGGISWVISLGTSISSLCYLIFHFSTSHLISPGMG